MSHVAGPIGRQSTVAIQPTVAVDEGAAYRGTVGRELAMAAGSLNELSESELTALLRDIELLDAVPSVDVDNTPSSPIAPEGRRRAPGAL